MVKAIARNPGDVPNAASSGCSPCTKSTRVGMSKPLSSPKRACTAGSWLRRTPGWICMTRPSCALIRPISNSMCAANACAPAPSIAPRRRVGVQPLGVGLLQRGGVRGQVPVVGGPRARAAGRPRGAAPARRGSRRRCRWRCPTPPRAARRRCFQPGRSRCTSASGRNVGTTTPDHPDSAMARWCDRSASGESVVASTSRPNRSYSARGRNSGRAIRSAICVVDLVGRLRGRRDPHPEDVVQLVLEPHPAGGAAEQVPAGAEPAPDGPAVLLDRAPVEARHAQVLQAGTLRHEHARDVVVGHDEQLRRVRERLVQRRARTPPRARACSPAAGRGPAGTAHGRSTAPAPRRAAAGRGRA